MQSMNGNKKTFYNDNNPRHSGNWSSNNYSDNNSPTSSSPPSIDTTLYSQHEELIRFITDSWNKVCHQYNNSNSPQVKYYTPDANSTNSDLLKHFTPVDLEALWGRRLHHNLVQRSTQPF
uniref:Uncharacterized protein n=1 Tax=Cacopsylla melanoneura TaxID=428564 RepID=A0A8D8LKM8_9HEMI